MDEEVKEVLIVIAKSLFVGIYVGIVGAIALDGPRLFRRMKVKYILKAEEARKKKVAKIMRNISEIDMEEINE